MNIGTRKLIWSAPLVAALAVVGALAIFAALGPNAAQAHDLPGAVTNLMVDDADYRTIDLSWDAPAGGMVDSYRIDRSKNGNVWMTHKTGVTETKYQDTMLTAGTDYYYRVFAVNSAGTGPVSGEVTGATKAPEPPGTVRSLTARATDQNTVVLNWMAPASDGGTKITGYKIAVADDDEDSTVIVAALPAAGDVGTAAESTAQIILTGDDAVMHTHKMRTAGIRYQYNVYAVNAEGTSAEPGDTVAATTHELQKPGAPTGVTAVQTAARDFSLYWFAPTNIGGFITDGDGNDIIDVTYTVQVSYNGSGFMDADPAITYTAAAGTSADATHMVPADYDHDGVGTTDPVEITTVRYRVYTVTRPDDTNTALPINEELKSTSAGMSDTMTIKSGAARDKDIPGAPTIVPADITRDSFKNVDLEWTAPPLDSSTTCDTQANTGCDDLVKSISGYRIDVSDDGVNWESLVSSTGKADPKYNYVDTEKKTRLYRIFAKHAQFLGPAADPATSTLETNATAPGHVTGLMATAAGPTQIDLSWTAPADNGNAPIVEYRIQMAMKGTDGTFADWPADVTPATDGVEVSKTTSYSHKDLDAGETWRYRVVAVNEDAAEVQLPTNATGAGAEVRQATTSQAALPEKPAGLTAEAAKDSSLEGAGNRGVLLLWNAPNPPDGATIDGYRVQRKKGDAAWETIAEDTNSTDTDYTDTSEPATGELRAYRVAALNGSKAGAWAMVYYPHALTQPGKPTLTAMKDADMPGTKVKLTWTAPAMNADLATGYIIERRHAGDMMGDIPSDGYNAGVMGASHAFMDYKEWWETLNCKGMLAVAGSSASDMATEDESAQDIADRDMYCKHFANTAPTNMAFAGKTVSEATAMKIKEMFMKRYVTDDMGKTMTMFTGMMYTDMGLMENKEYTYRVRAIHGMKAGMWSDTATVTTGTDNTAPMKLDTIADMTVMAGQMSEAMDVSMYFSDADTDDTLTYTAMSNMEMYATAAVSGSMLTITGVAEGEATITVTATDMDGAMATQTFMVTVEATDTMLGNAGTPSGTPDVANPDEVTFRWTPGDNATIHWVAVARLNAAGDDIDTSFTPIWEADTGNDGMHTVTLGGAGTYVIAVIAGRTEDTTTWSMWKTAQYIRQ